MGQAQVKGQVDAGVDSFPTAAGPAIRRIITLAVLLIVLCLLDYSFNRKTRTTTQAPLEQARVVTDPNAKLPVGQ